jgi:energy-coupling factor transporter ATP-binding protein EcfA2
MRIIEIVAKDKAPIKNFEVTNLSNIIVLAGPNGIGKTRLTQQMIGLLQNPRSDPTLRLKIEATTESEIDTWKKRILFTLESNDSIILRQHLQRNRMRGKWSSSIINFDSSRTFEPIRPFQWSWDFRDPFKEEINWNLLLDLFKNRYQDTIHALYRKLGHYRTEISKQYEDLRRAGITQMPIDPTDPLAKFKDIFKLLLSPKELLEIPLTDPKLQYKEENGQILPIDALSSGEREVFTIVFDLLLHEPSDCIIFFDEPEMHLHPELCFRLFRALENVGERNQFIFCTHSPDIITESLDHSVVFIKPPKNNENQAICVRKDDEKAIALKLLGQNLGVIALGRKLVLIEGDETSLDKQTYGEIVGNLFPQYVLVPVGPRQTMISFSQIIDDVLSKSLWGIDFCMISDHDCSLPDNVMTNMISKSAGRLAFIPRYHLENYFLNEDIISRMFEKQELKDSWLRDPNQVKVKLKEIAKESIPYSVHLWLNTIYNTKIGEINFKVKGVDKLDLENYLRQLTDSVSNEQKRIEAAIAIEMIENDARKRWELLETYIANDDPKWKKIIPGRTICHKFCSSANMDLGRFKTMYINQAREEKLTPFNDIIDIFKKFDSTLLNER